MFFDGYFMFSDGLMNLNRSLVVMFNDNLLVGDGWGWGQLVVEVDEFVVKHVVD